MQLLGTEGGGGAGSGMRMLPVFCIEVLWWWWWSVVRQAIVFGLQSNYGHVIISIRSMYRELSVVVH